MPRSTRKRKIYKGGAPTDEIIGVLISQMSLNHENPAYNGTPYVIIIPEKFNGGTKAYAYGVSAADAVKAAQNKRFTTRGFEATDTYTGVGLSATRIMSANATEKVAPYVINLGEKGLRYGSSPAQITGTRRILDRFKKGMERIHGFSLRKKSAPAPAGAATATVATTPTVDDGEETPPPPPPLPSPPPPPPDPSPRAAAAATTTVDSTEIDPAAGTGLSP